jgi:hypothetical protein
MQLDRGDPLDCLPRRAATRATVRGEAEAEALAATKRDPAQDTSGSRTTIRRACAQTQASPHLPARRCSLVADAAVAPHNLIEAIRAAQSHHRLTGRSAERPPRRRSTRCWLPRKAAG